MFPKKVALQFFLGLALVLSLVAPSFAESANNGDISASQAQDLIKKEKNKLIIVDVRTPGEFSRGHIKNAKNIDFFGSKFEQEASALPKDAAILLYCRTGQRSASARDLLVKDGFKNVRNMKGGILAWEKNEGQLTKGN